MKVITVSKTIEAAAVRILEAGTFSYHTADQLSFEEWQTGIWSPSRLALPFLRLVADEGKILAVSLSRSTTDEPLLTIPTFEAMIQDDRPGYLFLEAIDGLHLQIDGRHSDKGVMINVTEEEAEAGGFRQISGSF